MRSDANQYLKWSFVEAANALAVRRAWHPGWHTTKLYERIRARKGHQTAIGAVARHLAEATYWVLTKQESYRDPTVRPRKDKRVVGHEPVRLAN